MVANDDISFQKALNRDWFRRCLTIDLVAELEYQMGELAEAEKEASPAWVQLIKAHVADIEAEIGRRQRKPLYTVSEKSRFTKQLVEEIKLGTNLADLISHDLQLIPSVDDQHRALCPFHDDKNPSFRVYNREGRYVCFGCGANGDAIQWLMARHNLTFREALTRLANAANITLPDIQVTRGQRPNIRGIVEL